MSQVSLAAPVRTNNAESIEPVAPTTASANVSTAFTRDGIDASTDKPVTVLAKAGLEAGLVPKSEAIKPEATQPEPGFWDTLSRLVLEVFDVCMTCTGIGSLVSAVGRALRVVYSLIAREGGAIDWLKELGGLAQELIGFFFPDLNSAPATAPAMA